MTVDYFMYVAKYYGHKNISVTCNALHTMWNKAYYISVWNRDSNCEIESDITWSAHHASKKKSPAFEVSIAAQLPLLEIKHTQLPLSGMWWTRWNKQWHYWIQDKYLSSRVTNLSMQLWSRSSGFGLTVMEKTSSSSCSEVYISSWLHWNLSDLSCRTVVGQEPLHKPE